MASNINNFEEKLNQFAQNSYSENSKKFSKLSKLTGFKLKMNDDKMNKINGIKAIFPDLTDNFIIKCLDCFNLDYQKTITAILDNQLPPDLIKLREKSKLDYKKDIWDWKPKFENKKLLKILNQKNENFEMKRNTEKNYEDDFQEDEHKIDFGISNDITLDERLSK
ncbi:hypothetical protein MHBO_002279 [Bonamia ostreae]|uniref:CUE domain-containing protein n=1 Tax=Bonamia ostreae TaxID=126728 RepID=A0ABV2ALS8_9EUKA